MTRDETLRVIAKILTVHGYRNSGIEDIHADGRINDKEMKELNKTIHNQIYTLLKMIDSGSINKRSYFFTGGEDWAKAVDLKWSDIQI
jgi:hypothetical protein